MRLEHQRVQIPRIPNLPYTEGRNLEVSGQGSTTLVNLALGMGIDHYDSIGLIEQCDGCQKVFMVSAQIGRAHV